MKIRIEIEVDTPDESEETSEKTLQSVTNEVEALFVNNSSIKIIIVGKGE